MFDRFGTILMCRVTVRVHAIAARVRQTSVDRSDRYRGMFVSMFDSTTAIIVRECESVYACLCACVHM